MLRPRQFHDLERLEASKQLSFVLREAAFYPEVAPAIHLNKGHINRKNEEHEEN
jgi:hypothetical protein